MPNNTTCTPLQGVHFRNTTTPLQEVHIPNTTTCTSLKGAVNIYEAPMSTGTTGRQVWNLES